MPGMEGDFHPPGPSQGPKGLVHPGGNLVTSDPAPSAAPGTLHYKSEVSIGTEPARPTKFGKFGKKEQNSNIP